MTDHTQDYKFVIARTEVSPHVPIPPFPYCYTSTSHSAQAVYFYTTEGRAQAFAFEGTHNYTPNDGC